MTFIEDFGNILFSNVNVSRMKTRPEIHPENSESKSLPSDIPLSQTYKSELPTFADKDIIPNF